MPTRSVRVGQLCLWIRTRKPQQLQAAAVLSFCLECLCRTVVALLPPPPTTTGPNLPTASLFALLAVSTLPAKPTAVVPSQLQPTPAELQAAHATLAKLANVKHAEQLPAQVWSLPPTANSEYGFFFSSTAAPAATGRGAQPAAATAAVAATATSGKFNHPLGTCDVTRWAGEYYSLTGKHLFAPKGGGSAAGSKGKGS